MEDQNQNNQNKQNEQQNKPGIKGNWNLCDETCPTCGAITKRQQGLTKQNIKRLFTFNYKSLNEWIWVAVILGVCFIAWAYQHDMAAYKDFMDHRVEYCMQLSSIMVGADINGNNYWRGLNVNGLGLEGINLSRDGFEGNEGMNDEGNDEGMNGSSSSSWTSYSSWTS
jgi:hypothetical protein